MATSPRPRSFKAELTGSFSTPCHDNPTVVMIESAYRALGLDWRYINAEVQPAGLAAAVAGARAMGWKGFNLSMPHKVAVIEHLDSLGESARLIGAVNCVVARDGRLVGENTDGKGFLSSLVPVRDPRGARVMLLGAGGAARAIAVELVLAGAASLAIVNRSPARGAYRVSTLHDSGSQKGSLGVQCSSVTTSTRPDGVGTLGVGKIYSAR